MRKLFIDFETYYDDSYSLRYLTPIEYVLHPMFELLGCAFHWEDEPDSYWIDGPEVAAHFQTIDPKTTTCISHNALFDMSILSLRLKFSPAAYGCTLSMANNWIRHFTNRVSLSACVDHYGFGSKMDTVLRLKNVNFHALQQNVTLHAECIAYGRDDVDKCKQLYDRMIADGFPSQQLEIIDMVIKMVTNPVFELDPGVLAEHLGEVLARKQELLDRVQMDTRDNLMKDAAFAMMLNNEGVKAPMKRSKTNPDKDIFAFAKTDKEFTALLEHENPEVQALVAARLGHKSTLEETRTRRFLKIAAVSKRLPVPLRYSGAHTHRFSGDWSLNLQNLPRGSKIRKALKAPPGMVVVSIDASQIEARLNAWMSGQEDLLEAFRLGRDVYSEFAGEIYNREINKKENPFERQVGKVAILSLGYGSSPEVFQNMLRNQAGIKLSEYDCHAIVQLYRHRYKAIVDNWRHADGVMLPIISGSSPLRNEAMWGPIHVMADKMVLPNGNEINYRMLRYAYQSDTGLSRWIFQRGDQMMTIYGAKLVENAVQALAFVHIMDVALRIKAMTKGLLMPAHQVHDELVYIVPERNGAAVGELVRREMSKVPTWGEGIPLAAEAHVGLSYGDAK